MKNALWMVVPLFALQTEAAEIYRLDAANTQIAFDVERFGIHWVKARFSDISGDFVLDREGASTRVDVTVGTASIECDDPAWNARLRSTAWLDVRRYPQMTYHSSHIELGNGRAIASGQLTLHGVTRSVVLTVSRLSCANQPSATCRFTAQARIKRSEFGLPHGFWMGGDQVEISIRGVVANPGR